MGQRSESSWAVRQVGLYFIAVSGLERLPVSCFYVVTSEDFANLFTNDVL